MSAARRRRLLTRKTNGSSTSWSKPSAMSRGYEQDDVWKVQQEDSGERGKVADGVAEDCPGIPDASRCWWFSGGFPGVSTCASARDSDL